jgi:hypothetical protein
MSFLTVTLSAEIDQGRIFKKCDPSSDIKLRTDKTLLILPSADYKVVCRKLKNAPKAKVSQLEELNRCDTP